MQYSLVANVTRYIKPSLTNDLFWLLIIQIVSLENFQVGTLQIYPAHSVVDPARDAFFSLISTRKPHAYSHKMQKKSIHCCF
jgi:hypothetical protein